MSLTCFGRRPGAARAPACLRASSVFASRKAVTASSGNFASMTSGRPSGRNTTQSGRLLFDSVYWNSKHPFGRPSWTIISIRPWPNAPRCLLVGEHALQRRDLRGEIGDVLLRAVDRHQAFVELLQALDGVLPGRRHRVAEVVRHRIEPLVDRTRQLGLSRADTERELILAAGQHVPHHLDPHRGLGLEARNLGHLAFGGLAVALAHRSHDRHRDQRQRHQDGQGDRRDDRQGRIQCQSSCHPTSIRSIRTESERKINESKSRKGRDARLGPD